MVASTVWSVTRSHYLKVKASALLIANSREHAPGVTNGIMNGIGGQYFSVAKSNHVEGVLTLTSATSFTQVFHRRRPAHNRILRPSVLESPSMWKVLRYVHFAGL